MAYGVAEGAGAGVGESGDMNCCAAVAPSGDGAEAHGAGEGVLRQGEGEDKSCRNRNEKMRGKNHFGIVSLWMGQCVLSTKTRRLLRCCRRDRSLGLLYLFVNCITDGLS